MVELRSIPNIKSYDNHAEALRFLLGGIGTGNISLNARGELCDFEIFNRQSKGLKLPYSFFALWYSLPSGESDALVLEAKPQGLCDAPMGVAPSLVPGLPRFDSSCFSSAYPFANIQLKKDGLPFEVTLQAYTPFIPLDDVNSGIPGIRFVYRLKNLLDQPVKAAVSATMPNACGFDSFSTDGLNKLYLKGRPENRVVKKNGLQGICYSTDLEKEQLGFGTMALLTDEQEGFSAKPRWLNEGWWDGAEEYWQDLMEDGCLGEAVSGGKPVSRINPSGEESAIGSIAVQKVLQPGASKDFVFYLTWHFPNRYGWWPDGHDARKPIPCADIYQNYYSTLWDDALAVAGYFHANQTRLEENSEKFANALFSSTVDPEVIDAAAGNITALRSTTCFRIADGTFFGWEGCFFQAGSCPGTCTHVWNYAQTVANLFPRLERNMRETEFLRETDGQGKMNFRAKIQLEGKPWDMYPAVDGQLGSILRVYREWKISGDDDFLKKIWNQVVSALEFSASYWDSNQDCVLDGQQHNTYDIEFYGVNSLGNSIYYAALKAGAEMAEYLGEHERSQKWRSMEQAGCKRMDEMLFNGEYYRQVTDGDIDEYKYQYGEGCLSDQLLGQTLAHLYGLGHLFPEDHVKSAVFAIYKYNFKERMGSHKSLQRGYAYQDEPGLLLCSWPSGGRPKQPFVYSDEVWTGIEYQVAAGLIYEGFLQEGLEIVRAVRSRYDGYKRNPFNEVECGNHYARSMASWGVLNALSGLQVDLPHNSVTISPKVNQDCFSSFYSTGTEWGICRQFKDQSGALIQSFEALYHAD